MNTFQDLLSNQIYLREELQIPPSFKVLEQELRPVKMVLSIKADAEKISELTLEWILDRNEEIQLLAPLLEPAGLALEQIKALLFSGTTRFSLFWRARPELIQTLQNLQLPLETITDFWATETEERKPFCDLDKNYFFIKLQQS
jgi:hypothetical protein